MLPRDSDHPSNNDDNVEEVPVSGWDEEEVNESELSLGPTDILGSFDPLKAFTAETVHIFCNNKYDLTDLADALIMEVDPQTLWELLRYALSRSESIIGTCLVSDGNTSHVISPTNMSNDGSERLFYFDPWNINSFLEEGRNLVGVRAKRHGDGIYSITVDEYMKVVIAIGFIGLTNLGNVKFRQRYIDLKATGFYEFFNIQEIGISIAEDNLMLIKLKTGGFKEFIDIEIQTDKADEIRHAKLILAREWIDQYGINLFANDVVKSFIDAFIPKMIDLSGTAVSRDPLILNPDRKLADFLVSVIWNLGDKEGTIQTLSKKSRLSTDAFQFVYTYLGHQESVSIDMPFSYIEAKNVNEDGKNKFYLDINITPRSAGLLWG